MAPPTEKQISFIRSLADRILAVDVNKLAAKAKAPAGFTFSPRSNAIAAQTIARKALANLERGSACEVGTAWSAGSASVLIDTLQIQARRAGV